MPELPEVEITARRLNRALAGATVESALAPGMVTMKTFDPPLDALAGREITRVRRAGKMPIVELGDLALLNHLMSAGRLQLFDTRASLRDKRSRPRRSSPTTPCRTSAPRPGHRHRSTSSPS